MSFGLALLAVSTIMSADAERKAGRLSAQRGMEQQIENEIAAGQKVAAGQRKMFSEMRDTKLMASRALALAGAGGGAGEADQAIQHIMREGQYRSELAMYDAEAEAEKLEYEGFLAAQYGRDKNKASKGRATATMIKGATSMYSQFGETG